MLLIFPPAAKPCEPPAGIASLAGALRAHGLPCTLFDANLEGLLYLLTTAGPAQDTWGRRAQRNMARNLASLRSPALYTNPARYRRAVADVNHLLDQAGRRRDLDISLANYQDHLSPLKSHDLLRAAARPEDNIFFPWFSGRLTTILEDSKPAFVGFSLNYLSQAITAFAMMGWLKEQHPGLPIILGGGLVTSWMSNPAWKNPFAGLVDHLIAGRGEGPLLRLLQRQDHGHGRPDFSGLPRDAYLAPGFILPYPASSGCAWRRCSFCPENAEETPYRSVSTEKTMEDLRFLTAATAPVLLHFLDNAMSPALMQALINEGFDIPWYSFARVHAALTDTDFCRGLRRSGCRMLKLGIESGDQSVLDAMDKGIDLDMMSRALTALQAAGIATYVYLLFGTPAESLPQARRTLSFVARHHEAITFLNLAIFNMPVCSREAAGLETSGFSEGDLSLYTDFRHPLGWDRKEVRRFLDQEFRRHPQIAPILRNDPPLFTSNHAPFFCYTAPQGKEAPD
ncbi:MAG: radical SAM protein [Desulfocapsaceae bacterium]|nr:radical SAM protein [Desulfocapsaceae bacterium]